MTILEASCNRILCTTKSPRSELGKYSIRPRDKRTSSARPAAGRSTQDVGKSRLHGKSSAPQFGTCFSRHVLLRTSHLVLQPRKYHSRRGQRKGLSTTDTPNNDMTMYICNIRGILRNDVLATLKNIKAFWSQFQTVPYSIVLRHCTRFASYLLQYSCCLHGILHAFHIAYTTVYSCI